jgi:hypothetical protein
LAFKRQPTNWPRCCIDRLNPSPLLAEGITLMRALVVIVGQPFIEVDLQLINGSVDQRELVGGINPLHLLD